MATKVTGQEMDRVGRSSSPKREEEAAMLDTGTDKTMKENWLVMVKDGFKSSRHAKNTFFGFILVVLEKIVEMEFACPCIVGVNTLFAIAYLLIPAGLAFVLVADFEDIRQFHNFVPPIIWSIIIFLDGRYFACAVTYWSGSYVNIPNAAPQKWCEPANNSSSQDYLIMTQYFYFGSQVIGMIVILILSTVKCVYRSDKTRQDK